MLALWLETRLGKRDILELYLNRVYFGAGAYGVETASRRFFGKSARDVTLLEAAVLAGLLKAPSRYSPASNPQVAAGARQRRAGQDGGGAPARRRRRATRPAAPTLRFAELARSRAVGRRLRGRCGAGAPAAARRLRRQRHRRRDHHRRAACSAAPRRWCRARSSGEGASAKREPGRPRAHGHGRRHPRAGRRPLLCGEPVQSRAQGQAPAGLRLQDVRLPRRARERPRRPTARSSTCRSSGSGWSPRNEGAGYRGAVTLREALAQSMNAAAARLNMTVGPRRTAAVARRLGIRSALRADASLALGTSEVTLARAHRRLRRARQRRPGARAAPHPARAHGLRPGAVRAPASRARRDARGAGARCRHERHAERRADVGYGKRAALPGHPAAGKTGTSQDFRDAWFVGYTGAVRRRRLGRQRRRPRP